MSVFSPNSKLSAETNPRDWTYELGLLPQSAAIVFTKASLIAYLKTHGVEVGPNNSEISKLPRYASIGKMEDRIQAAPVQKEKQQQEKPAHLVVEPRKAPSPAKASVPEYVTTPSPEPAAPLPREVLTASTISEAPAALEVRTADGEVFRPTRRVREPIGGGSAQLGALFGSGGDDHDEIIREAEREAAKRRGLAQELRETGPPKVKLEQAPLQPSTTQNQQPAQRVEVVEKASTAFRPTRRVREPGGTGGPSSFSLG